MGQPAEQEHMVTPVAGDMRIIFICYRREDSGDHAHRLRDALSTSFGESRVFIDLEIPPGADVRRYIAEKLSSCVVLLAVIGPDWLTSSDEHGAPRLTSELDFVRLEIATALQNDETVVMPLLVKNARMPNKSELPQEIERLADLNAHGLADGVHWQYDVTRLTAAIKEILPPAGAPRRPAGGLSVPFEAMWTALTRRRYAVAAATALAVLAAMIIAVVVSLSGDPTLRIYSSLPQQQQLQPLDAEGRHDLPVVRHELTRDREDAMRLALKQAGGRAGDFAVTYKALDASDPTGESPTAVVQDNARQAAEDEDTAVYIGDLTSGATQVSIPILSRAKVPQLSMSSTRIGLTRRDRRGDVDEPDRYYPPQPGYPNGYRNFVRIIPRDTIQAKALLALMTQQDGCGTVAMINDNSSYGEALANNILAQNHHRARFQFSQSVSPRGEYEHLVDRAAKAKPECVVYCGTRNPNTVEIFEAFAKALPRAKLYGTDGLVAANFFDFRKGGLAPQFADAVKVMVPPYDVQQATSLFFGPFRDEYGREADPNAVYAYEAMRVALDAITESVSGKRKDIRAKLFETTRERQASTLGRYEIDASGDTDVARYGVSTIVVGDLTDPVRAPRCLRSERWPSAHAPSATTRPAAPPARPRSPAAHRRAGSRRPTR